ncbi:MAG: DUF6291 domain-containing protein [Aequorivita sp.]|nr:DUF6291 domain-containing protein [Aequorivita sp.]
MSKTNIGKKSQTRPNTTFVLHKSWATEIQRLTDRQAGKLIKALFEYVNGAPDPLSAGKHTTALFNKITTQIDQERAKYNPVTGRYHWNFQGGVSFRGNSDVV